MAWNKSTPKGLYGIVALFAVFIVFMILELTAFNDAMDLNNSIILALSVASIAGLFKMRKAGAAVALFTLIYIFTFNTSNVVYYYPTAALLNGSSAILTAIATIYMFITIFSNRYK